MNSKMPSLKKEIVALIYLIVWNQSGVEPYDDLTVRWDGVRNRAEELKSLAASFWADLDLQTLRQILE